MHHEALLQLKMAKFYSRVLGFANWKQQLGNVPECSEEERKAKSFYGKKYILEKNQPCILSLWIGLR